MIIEIQLPFNRFYVCNVCGASGWHPDLLDEFKAQHSAQHLSREAAEWEVKVGDVVKLSVPALVGGGTVRESWAVDGMFHAGDRSSLFFEGAHEPQLHELCLTLHHPRRKKRCIMYLTLSDFLLLRAGDEARIIAAGLAKKRRKARSWPA